MKREIKISSVKTFNSQDVEQNQTMFINFCSGNKCNIFAYF